MKINTYAVNCNDAWLNTEGDDISGSYVKYKDHQAVVAELEARCAALTEKGMELTAEAAVVYGKYNETQLPDRDLVDMQPLQEVHDLCSVVKNTDAFLAEVRAQESKRVYESIMDNPSVTDMESLVDWLEQNANDSLAYAAKLRQGANTADLLAAGIITKVGE